MVRSSKPKLLPALLWLTLFFGGLVAVHLFVDSLVAREIAGLSLLITFFVGIHFWSEQ